MLFSINKLGLGLQWNILLIGVKLNSDYQTLLFFSSLYLHTTVLVVSHVSIDREPNVT